MKVMTYNILLGGEGRLEAIIDTICTEKPDILGIQEANHFDENNRLQVISERAGLPYTALALGAMRNSGRRFHVATLSRTEIKAKKCLEGFHHAGLQTIIVTEFGLVSVVNVHLSLDKEYTRMQEACKIIIAQEPFEQSIILGDHNALSPKDNYDQSFFNDALKYFFTRDGKITTDAIDRIEKARFFDGKAREMKPKFFDTAFLTKNQQRTFPTPISRHSDSPRLRIDYIFVSEALSPHLKKTKVVQSDASDHYPYWAYFE